MTPRTRALLIVERIAEARGFTPDDLLGFSRGIALVRARAHAYKALSEEMVWTYAQIGKLFSRTRQAVHKTITEAPEELRFNHVSVIVKITSLI